MGSQARALTTREQPVELERDRALGLAARQRAFELLPEGAARAEDQGLDRGRGRSEHRGELAVGAALQLPHRERGALVETELRERAQDVLAPVTQLVLGPLRSQLRIEHDLTRSP